MENFVVNNSFLRLVVFVACMSLLWFAEHGWPLSMRRKNSPIPNLVLTVISLMTYVLLGLALVPLTRWTNDMGIGIFNWFDTIQWLELISGVMLLDLWAAYFVHYLFHKIPWFWNFHRIHHTDTTVDVTTSLRQHPVESTMRFLFLFTGTLLLGLPLWIVLIYQMLSSINALLEHSNIRLNTAVDKILGVVFITPGLHKIHHSALQSETDSNYSNIFSIWDRVFGTINSKRVNHVIQYGLGGATEESSAMTLLTKPFRKDQQQKVSSEDHEAQAKQS